MSNKAAMASPRPANVRKTRPILTGLVLASDQSATARAHELTPQAANISESADPYTNPSSQHQTQVEPDAFAFGSTIVAAVQSGRFFDGGSSNIGWATSTDNGATWTQGFLPATTVFATPAVPFARISDPAVAYDARHNVWLIAALPLAATLQGSGVSVNRSTDGGHTWSGPVLVNSTQSGTDKDWIVCDNTPSSPFYGHCYVEWDGICPSAPAWRTDGGWLGLAGAEDPPLFFHGTGLRHGDRGAEERVKRAGMVQRR
jgi:hypothetical protein